MKTPPHHRALLAPHALRAALLFAIGYLLLAISSPAAVVYGFIHDLDSSGLSTSVTFIPPRQVLISNLGLSAGPAITTVITNGAFTNRLDPGEYWVSLPLNRWRDPFAITVPAIGGPYNITNLTSGVSSYLSWVTPDYVTNAILALASGSTPIIAGSNIVIYPQGGSNVIASTAIGGGGGNGALATNAYHLITSGDHTLTVDGRALWGPTSPSQIMTWDDNGVYGDFNGTFTGIATHWSQDINGAWWYFDGVQAWNTNWSVTIPPLRLYGSAIPTLAWNGQADFFSLSDQASPALSVTAYATPFSNNAIEFRKGGAVVGWIDNGAKLYGSATGAVWAASGSGPFTGAFTGSGFALTNLDINKMSNAPVLYASAFGVVGDGVTDNALSISNALRALTNNLGGVLVFPPGKFASSGHHVLPESGGFNLTNGTVGPYQQPGIIIRGSGNTVLLSTDTNPNNGPFFRGGVDWENIVLQGPGMQYACTGLVQRIPGNNRYTHVTWQNWGAYGALLDDTTHVMFWDCYFTRCHIGLGYSFKVDNAYFFGRFDFCDYGAELGALGVGSANHSAGTAGGSSSDKWFITANICTNAVMIIGAQSSRQEITAYMENANTSSTNGYFWIGHDPAKFTGGGTATYNEGAGLASDKIRFINCKGLQDIGGFVRVYSPVQEMTLDGVAQETGGPLVWDTINGVLSAHFRDADAANNVVFTNADGEALYGFAGQTVEWTSPQHPGYSLYDRSGVTGGAHYESWRYQGAHDGGLRMVWADANDKTMRTPFAQIQLTNAQSGSGQYRLTLDGVSINQGPNTAGLSVSNYFAESIFFGGITLGGVRNTSWPAGGSGDVNQSAQNNFTGSNSLSGATAFKGVVILTNSQDLILGTPSATTAVIHASSGAISGASFSGTGPSLGIFVLSGTNNSAASANWFGWTLTPTNLILMNVGTNGGGGWNTNFFYFGNGSGSNAFRLVNSSGSTLAIISTNGWTSLAGGQLIVDTVGNTAIGGALTSQNLLPASSGNYDVGAPASQWRDGWFSRILQSQFFISLGGVLVGGGGLVVTNGGATNASITAAGVVTGVSFSGLGTGLWNTHVDGSNVSNAVASATAAVTATFVTGNGAALTNQVYSTNAINSAAVLAAASQQTNFTVNLLPGPAGNMLTLYPGNTNVFVTFTGTNNSDWGRSVNIDARTNSIPIFLGFASRVETNQNASAWVTNGFRGVFNFYNVTSYGTNNLWSDAGRYQ